MDQSSKWTFIIRNCNLELLDKTQTLRTLVFQISSQLLPPKVNIPKIQKPESRAPNQTLQIPC